jgi:biotin carboxyl carrier protein
MKKFQFTIGPQEYNVEIEDPSSSVLVVKVNGKAYTVCKTAVAEPVTTDLEQTVTAAPAASQSTQTASVPKGSVLVKAPIPGKIISVAVEVGDHVRYSDALCTLEAMKMESVIRAPANGTVEEVRVQPGDNMQHDDVLIVLKTVLE